MASALCKCGGVDKIRFGVEKEYKIRDSEEFEAACNPILQAELLKDAETEINVIVGLCIGHDMLFTMNSRAPVTTLIVKDRMLGHNPVISLYSGYHKGIIEYQRTKLKFRLNYPLSLSGLHVVFPNLKNGGPAGIRTRDFRLRRPTPYPG